MTAEEKAARVLDLMFDNDPFSQWLGMEKKEIGPGFCELSMTVRSEMLNGFSLAHGSITYALADSVLAFASNSHGKKCLSIDTQISHLLPCKEGDVLRAVGKEVSRSRKLGRYNVEVLNQHNDLVAHFIGTVYIKDEEWNVGNSED